MANNRLVTTGCLLLSVLLHLSLLLATPLPQQQTRHAEHRMQVQYVVRSLPPAPAHTPVMLPAVAPSQAPIEPAVPTTQPRQPQPRQRPQPLQSSTAPPDVLPTPVMPTQTHATARPRQPLVAASAHTVQSPQAVPQPPDSTRLRLVQRTVESLSAPVPRHPVSLPQQAALQPQSHEPETALATYLARIRQAIEQHKYYPALAQRAGITGQVMLQFVILADGHILEPRILQSSAPRVLSTAALTSLQQASPLPPLPSALKRNRLVVQVPITYTLKDTP